MYVLKDQYAKQYAKELYAAKGLVNDDEDAVQAVFRSKVKDKVHVSNIAGAFEKDYSKNLLEYLRNFLSSSELKSLVLDPVRNLPNYRIV